MSRPVRFLAALRRLFSSLDSRLYLAVSPGSWWARMLFVLLALTASLAVVALALLADAAASLYGFMTSHLLWLPVLLMPAGFAFNRWLTARFFGGVEGSGIPQVIAQIRDGHRLPTDAGRVGWWRAVGKLLLTPLSLAFGASAGCEGPSVFVGAALMHAGHRWRVIRRIASERQLLVAGGAVGIAAAFNTPLGGIMFAIEELSEKHRFHANAATLSAVIMAGLCSLALMGNYLYFGRSHDSLDILHQLPVVIVCGTLGGAGGGLFSWLALNWQRLLPVRVLGFASRRAFIFAALCGLGAGLLAWASAGLVAGSGYEAAHGVVSGEAGVPLWYAPAKLLATLLTFMSGIPAGIFAPSLSIGAGLSALAAGLFPGVSASVLALLCMVAYLSGMTHAPITAFTVAMEMTDNHALLIPLMAAAVIGQMTARLCRQQPVYHGLAARLLQKTE
ncbi:MAG: chloride channel protein [Candidatus Dactylopiibacterium carminicum]|nr:MAG: chloride channel protein [Candidatus Dactylopiibacterium carminicum]